MAQLTVPVDSGRFAKGMTWKDYMAQMGETQKRTEDNYNKASLSADDKAFFGSVKGVKSVLMLAENWCGDVHRNSPLIARIVESIPGAELRVFLRDQNLDITDCYLNNGFRSIPVVVFTPEGKMVFRILLPERCANLCFGGPSRNRLFMAASQSVYALYVDAQGATLS